MNKRKTIDIIKNFLLIFLATVIALSAALSLFYLSARAYFDRSKGVENSFYSSPELHGKKVMIIVPHEDDDILTAGNVIPGLIKAGCDIKLVFSTLGDKTVEARVRIKEAVEGQKELGLDSSNLIFLGYPDGKMQYADKSNKLVYSGTSRLHQTHAAHGFDDYHFIRFGTHADYTRENFMSDIKNVILDYKPEILIVTDLDAHMDHRGLSLAFEKVMGEILASGSGYTPTVLRIFPYSSAWRATPDFYNMNIRSVELPQKSKLNNPEYETDIPQYTWKNRIRLPAGSKLSRSLISCEEYKAFREHLSQFASVYAERIVNGDTVGWLRRTDSLTYNAKITVSTGTAGLLNDFSLVDTVDIKSKNTKFSNCVSYFSDADDKRSVTVTFDSPKTISQVSLYDDFSLKNNITSGKLIFSDGSTVKVPALNENGSETVVTFGKKNNITSFTFVATSFEGRAGLCEIEAFESLQSTPFPIIKIKSASTDDFLYHCFLPKDAKQMKLGVYSTVGDEYRLNVSGKGVTLKDGTLVFDKSFKSCTVTATLRSDPAVSDSVRITRLGAVGEQVYKAFEAMDKKLYKADTIVQKLRNALENGYLDNIIDDKIKSIFKSDKK